LSARTIVISRKCENMARVNIIIIKFISKRNVKCSELMLPRSRKIDKSQLGKTTALLLKLATSIRAAKLSTFGGERRINIYGRV